MMRPMAWLLGPLFVTPFMLTPMAVVALVVPMVAVSVPPGTAAGDQLVTVSQAVPPPVPLPVNVPSAADAVEPQPAAPRAAVTASAIFVIERFITLSPAPRRGMCVPNSSGQACACPDQQSRAARS